MRILTAISVVIFLFLAPSISAQNNRSKLTIRNSKRNGFTTPKFKKNKKTAIICPVFEIDEYPYQSIGFKAGDPFAVTYKVYVNKNFSFAADFGLPALGLYGRRYIRNFDIDPDYDTLTYYSHDINSNYVVSLKLEAYNEGPFIKGLYWYYGVGWQIRYSDLNYGYNYEVGLNIRRFGVLNESGRTMGPEAVLGIEYSYFDLPISAFVEVNGYYDINQLEGWSKFQGGVGLRYVF